MNANGTLDIPMSFFGNDTASRAQHKAVTASVSLSVPGQKDCRKWGKILYPTLWRQFLLPGALCCKSICRSLSAWEIA